jgi:hypothetical protein
LTSMNPQHSVGTDGPLFVPALCRTYHPPLPKSGANRGMIFFVRVCRSRSEVVQ